MRLGFKRPKYVKTGQKIDMDTHSNRPIYNYIEWLADTSRKYGIPVTYGESAKGHYIEIRGGYSSLNNERIYTLHAAKMIRERILQYVRIKLRDRNHLRSENLWQKRKLAFLNGLTPEQRAFWTEYNRKIESERGW